MLSLALLVVVTAAIRPLCVSIPTTELLTATPNEIGMLVPLPPADIHCPRLGVSCAIDQTSLLLADDGQRDGPAAPGIVACYRAAQEKWIFSEFLSSPSPLQGDRFGAAMALDGNCLLVGSPGDPIDGPLGGTAWVFRFDGRKWQPEANLTPLKANAGAQFGYTVALQGDCAVIGSPRQHLDGHWHVGRVEIFHYERNQWKRSATIDPPMVSTSLWFGYEVALAAKGTCLAIGVPGLDEPIDRCGGVMLATRDGAQWKLAPRPVHRAAATPLERFGSAVVATNSAFLASAPGAEPEAAGLLSLISIHTPSRLLGDWIEPTIPQGRLGTRLATSQGWAAATIPGWQEAGERRGAVRIFRLNHGHPVAILDLQTEENAPPLGRAIALSHHALLVTAVPDEDDPQSFTEAWVIPLENVVP